MEELDELALMAVIACRMAVGLGNMHKIRALDVLLQQQADPSLGGSGFP
ncbi:MAG: hypothetical protein KJ670_14285 [Alphaproteobacteria bacterium]|nr:hypothetical protein [Alphaproteobacteria bacterium]MBU4050539.1 hypothetical protein [Alphaproteobacteria bacterium]MBU4089877.1 hypothetical protein [Alphaproteobacteria bacterium]MBU4157070.1 hypothetical protein [Alphaproteobacteria bacterium]